RQGDLVVEVHAPPSRPHAAVRTLDQAGRRELGHLALEARALVRALRGPKPEHQRLGLGLALVELLAVEHTWPLDVVARPHDVPRTPRAHAVGRIRMRAGT